MKITTTKKDQILTVSITGSIDTVTTPELEKKLNEHWNGIAELILDFSGVEYISSTGLRMVILANRHMGTEGKLILKNVSEDVMEIFKMTGFDDFLNFE